jgi:hypothetical protein
MAALRTMWKNLRFFVPILKILAIKALLSLFGNASVPPDINIGLPPPLPDNSQNCSCFYLLWSRSKITGTFCRGLGGAFGFAGSLQSYGFAPLRQPQNSSPIPSIKIPLISLQLL